MFSFSSLCPGLMKDLIECELLVKTFLVVPEVVGSIPAPDIPGVGTAHLGTRDHAKRSGRPRHEAHVGKMPSDY